MSFSYLNDLYTNPDGAAGPPTGTLQFHIPDYLYDAPPALASGGGAEAFHPAVAAQWLANSGFQQSTQYAAPQFPALADAWNSLEALQSHFCMGMPLEFHHVWEEEDYRTPSPSIMRPLTAGLPVYSQSGFDVLQLLSRVQSRKNPLMSLGPIDLTTSFVIADVRRHDTPIVYCSPSFCTLTGYREREVLGRNCRFLQAPPSAEPIVKGAPRQHTSTTAVRQLAKAVSGAKETQVSVVNYRKDGTAFVNLVSVVPLYGEFADSDEETDRRAVWFVGFQVDLGQQSEVIVERVRDGRYYKGAVSNPSPVPQAKKDAPLKEKRSTAVPPPRVSAQLTRLLGTPAFLASCGVPSSTAGGGIPPDPTSHALHCLLLQELPDFVHVLSLKGAFLYVAPAVTRVLGWAPADLVGRALADVCFQKDVVAVGRALKEASLPVDGFGDSSASKGAGPVVVPPEALRPVDLVFRARTKGGAWVWVECRGRLHVEPGKGRKAIVLVGRARAMAQAGDTELVSSNISSPVASPFAKRPRLEGSSPALSNQDETPSAATPTAFHGLLDPHGLLLSVGAGALPLLGWDPLALRGTRLGELVVPDMRLSAASSLNSVDLMLAAARQDADTGLGAGVSRHFQCTLRGAEGRQVAAVVALAAPRAHDATLPPAVGPARLMYAVRAASAPAPAAPFGKGAFDRLDPATGGSWQYELQQLRFANARLEEEIADLEREHAAEEARRREQEEKQRREVDAYSQQVMGGMLLRYSEETPPQWDNYAYRMPAKRSWDRRD